MKLTIQELADIVNEQLKDEVEFKKDSRQSSVVSERRIRDYMTKGMLSKPYGDGKNKWFDEKHVEQLVALRLLQMRGLSDQYIVDNSSPIQGVVDDTDLTAKSLSGLMSAQSSTPFVGSGDLLTNSSINDEKKSMNNLSNAFIAGASVPKHYVNSEVIEYLKKSNALYSTSSSSNLKRGMDSHESQKMSTQSNEAIKNNDLLSFDASESRSLSDLSTNFDAEDIKKQNDALNLLKDMQSGQNMRSVGASASAKNINVGPMSFTKQTQSDSRKKITDVDLLNYVSKKQDSKTYVEYVLDEENKVFLKVEQGEGVNAQRQQEIVNELKAFMLSLTKKGVGNQ